MDKPIPGPTWDTATADLSHLKQDMRDLLTAPTDNITLNQNEVDALCRILEREWIDHEDREAHMVVNKLFECKRNYERDLARTINKD